MSTFNNPNILQGAIKGAMQTGAGEAPEGRTRAVQFRQISSGQSSRQQRAFAATEGNAAARRFSSFLQTKESTRLKSRIVGDLLGAAFAPPPAVKLQLTEVKEPDPQIKEKMDEIEQLRADEETKGHLKRKPTRSGNSKQAVGKALQIAAAKPGSYAPSPLAFRQVKEGAANEKDLKPTSFLQLGSSASSGQQAKFGLSAEKQLNVKIAQSDKPYPTVDELVSDMQKKRDSTERLERMKILQLQLKLLKVCKCNPTKKTQNKQS
ncbi:hypothetical protein Efla_006447 [Eimeria flavescens]